MSGIRLWNGDIYDLEVDAIVVPTTTMLWMTSGAAAAVKQRGGHGIDFEAVVKAPERAGVALRGARTYEAFRAKLGRQRVLRAVPIVPGAHSVVGSVMRTSR